MLDELSKDLNTKSTIAEGADRIREGTGIAADLAKELMWYYALAPLDLHAAVSFNPRQVIGALRKADKVANWTEAYKLRKPIVYRGYKLGVIQDAHKILHVKRDAKAVKLAERIGGVPQVFFSKDPARAEFDAVSRLYVAQTKTKWVKGSRVRAQIKNTVNAAVQSNRQPYFHVDGSITKEMIDYIYKESLGRGVLPVIDMAPL